MTEQPGVWVETSRWPHTRQDFPTTAQPASGIHNASPSAPPSGLLTPNTTSPLGLASLTHLESVSVDPNVTLFKSVLGHHRKNKYVLMTDKGEWLFNVQEDSSLISRIFCGSSRHMEFKLFDKSQQEVLRFRQPTSYFFKKLEVYSGDRRLGAVHQIWSRYPKAEVQDHSGKAVFIIEGDVWRCDCKFIEEFRVYSVDKSRQIGVITKQWLNTQSERPFTSAGAFSVSFPVDLQTELKALLLAGAIYLDYSYFE